MTDSDDAMETRRNGRKAAADTVDRTKDDGRRRLR
jgi:hypothetical protein